MRISVLGSGSGGNATLIEAGATRVLVDAGFSARDVARRLERIGVQPGSVQGIVVTHDHGDHTRGVGVFVTTIAGRGLHDPHPPGPHRMEPP